MPRDKWSREVERLKKTVDEIQFRNRALKDGRART